MNLDNLNNFEVAIIGMAGRFPGSDSVRELWRHLENGVEGISFFEDDEMEAQVAPEDMKNSRFVKAKGIVESIEFFDATFFNISAREAEWMDPQQRVFLECAWGALEDAGYNCEKYKGLISVYAGVSTNTYLLSRLNQLSMSSPSEYFSMLLANEKDHLATRVSYKMNLRGESITIQTACSTSLVAVHLACQSLISGQSDIALAGGVSIQVPQKIGYFYQDGLISSPDGHCRAFDHRAMGTVPGHGVGIVVLKLLSEAIRDRDHIYAVIKGSAINNDGHAKIGYTAPSVEGQADVIRKALSIAGVSADSISFVEAHGTGTSLGDPIEIEALTQVFREHTARKGFCALGALKTNIGHLDTAAGVAGLIKCALSLDRKKITPTLHFEEPNPALNLNDSPFYVPTRLLDWDDAPTPRRAGVSSFGMGGTNAHVVMEEALGTEVTSNLHPWQLITLSAKTTNALENMTADLGRYLDQNPSTALADIAYTRNIGRQEFTFRRFAVVRNHEEAVNHLVACPVSQAVESTCIAFMFAGQEAPSVGIGAELYEFDPTFRDTVDQCAEILLPHLGVDLRRLLYPSCQEVTYASSKLVQPEFSVPALFLIEYALAKMLMSWGIQPAGMIGDGFGEFVAACLAGVFSLEDALLLICLRGRLMLRLAPATMLIDAILADFVDVVESLDLKAPCLPYVSSLTGSWIKAEQATDPAYWGEQMCHSVRFVDGLETLRLAKQTFFIEIGPTCSLSERVKKHFDCNDDSLAVSVLHNPQFGGSEWASALYMVGKAWASGATVDWQGFYRHENRRRLPLPTYPFDRQRHWIEARIEQTPDVNPDHAKLDSAESHGTAQPPAQELSAAVALERRSLSSEAPMSISAIEEKLTAIWGEVLGASNIGVHDDFFALGGDSLLATQMYTRIKESFASDISLREILTLETIAEQAQALHRNIFSTHEAKVATVQVNSQKIFPASYAQQRLWFIDQLGGSAHYNMPGAVRIQGKFNEDIAEKALIRIIERHAALRTVFLNGEDGPMQQIQDEFDFHLIRLDLSGISTETQEQAITEALNADYAAPFNLSAGLMFRASFIRLSERDGVLLFNMHHIASDGWSMGVLVKEFAQLYDAFSQGKPEPLTPLAIQYTDYAKWQRDWMQSKGLEQQISYWERQLADLPQLHGLPLDRPRPAIQTFNGAVHMVHLEPATLSGLKRVALGAHATLFMVLHGIFALLLSRHSNSNDVVIGVPVANRMKKELESLVGFFVNTLVLRTDCSGGQSFQDYLAEIRRVNLDAQANQDVPFEYLVERLKPRRTTSHEVLFQIMFIMNMTTNEPKEMQSAGLTMTPLRSDQIMAKCDLTMSVEEDGELHVGFSYNSDLFDATTIVRMGEHFKNLLQGVVDDPGRNVEELPLLTELEQQHLLYALNNTSGGCSHNVCIHQLFEEQVERSPEAVAVIFEGQRLSYRELNRRANQVAHYLGAQGVKADTLVGLCLERSLEMVVGMLGILKAGGAYVPLDPGYPQERLEYMIRDSEAMVVLTQVALQERLSASRASMLLLDDEQEVLQKYSDDNPRLKRAGLTPRHLAYVIYTSGSTGQPKGVMNEHAGVVNGLLWARDTYGLGQKDLVLQKTPFSFDVSVWEFLLPLISGAQLVVARPGGHLDPQYLAEIIERERITTVHFVPSMLQAFLEYGETEKCRGLRRMLCSGEALSYALQVRFMATFPEVELYNLYGPTEAAIHTTSWLCQEGVYEGIVPIGRPIANTQVYILNDDLQLTPHGVPGEIYLGGAGVARGYWKRPELTEERFVTDKFRGQGNARLYKTGDLGRWLADGSIEYLGRNDFQVKIRGFRIELGEIESGLRSCPGVQDAVVVVRESESGDKRLVGHLTIDEEHRQGASKAELAAELRRRLQSQLPEYMVPSAFVILDEMPLTSNGKLDRKALSGSDIAPMFHEYAAPATPAEITMARIWAEVLNCDPKVISANANFFELGGNSLLAMRLMTKLRSLFGAELTLRELFAAPALSDFVRRVARAEASLVPAISVVDRNLPLPLSFAQQRLWVLDQIDRDSSRYNLPVALRMKGSLNRLALQRTLDTLIERHEVLRTTFSTNEGVPRQVIHSARAVKIKVIDLSSQPALERDVQAIGLAKAESIKPFRLAFDPMLRVTLIVLSEEEHVVLFTQHHIASDGWSVGILVREFRVLYESYSQMRENPLPPLEIQYADYAHWQRQLLQGDVLEKDLTYWTRQLTGAPPVHELPLDKERPSKQDFAGATHWQWLDESLTQRLKHLCQRENVTLFMLLETAFALLVSRNSHQTDVVVGTPVAGRLHEKVEPLIGFFINNLVLRSRFDGDPSFLAALAGQKQMILDAYAHQSIPFEMLVKHLNPERRLSHDPIFQIVFSLNNNDIRSLDLPDLTITPVVHDMVLAKVDLEVVASENDGRLSVGWTYRTSLFAAASIGDLAMSYERLLQSIVNEPARGIFDFTILDVKQEEREAKNIEEGVFV